MNGYSVIEAGVVNQLITHFSAELSSTRCKAGDIDAVIEAIFKENATYGCWVDFGDPVGREPTGEPFRGQILIWQIVGVFFIRYNDAIDVQARGVIDKLATLFADDHTLGGLASKVKMISIDLPQPTQVDDTPFYFCPFVVEAWDK